MELKTSSIPKILLLSVVDCLQKCVFIR